MTTKEKIEAIQKLGAQLITSMETTLRIEANIRNVMSSPADDSETGVAKSEARAEKKELANKAVAAKRDAAAAPIEEPVKPEIKKTEPKAAAAEPEKTEAEPITIESLRAKMSKVMKKHSIEVAMNTLKEFGAKSKVVEVAENRWPEFSAKLDELIGE